MDGAARTQGCGRNLRSVAARQTFDSNRRVNMDRLVIDLATRFALVQCEGLDDAIGEGLSRMAKTLSIDRVFLWQQELGSIPFVASKLEAGEAISFTRVDEVPGAINRAALLRYGLRSAAIVPVPIPAAPAKPYALALGSEVEIEWAPALLVQLRLLSGVFGQALARASTSKALQRVLGELRQLREERVEHRTVKTLGTSRCIVSECPAVQRAFAQAAQVAPLPSTVLLLGETGVGKEVFAEAIHELSPRHGREMIRVNCSAIPSGLIESELFGHERGAFTGANTRQIGRFEAANHSTLFLDEIGELSPEMQIKLLRVLENREIERLGSTQSIKLDIRIIAATNRNLEQAIETGDFREDLFYRLNVFPIVLPPLRKRVKDIPGLAWQFIDEFSKKYGKRIEGISKQSMEELRRYPWPGNIRELRNIIERSVIRTTGETLLLSMPDDHAHAPQCSFMPGDGGDAAVASPLHLVEMRAP
jgi:formate hydrogenlyase transcriptional activator